MLYQAAAGLALLSGAQAGILNAARAAAATVTVTATVTESSSTSSVPDYFQTTPEVFAGPTPTGVPPFLVETNPVTFASVSFMPAAPLQTQEPISGDTTGGNIFHLMGNLSPYFASPGFGVDEFSLPAGSNVTWVNMLSRHGSRYPTSDSGPEEFGDAIANVTYNHTATGNKMANFTGELAFLNTWEYKLGAEILVPWGRQELYDSGVLHQYLYGHLYPNNGSKILVRTTTMDRMVKSAENFMAGFFGLGWTANATLELIIDELYYNNSLAGYNACDNNENEVSSAGANATSYWASIYLKNATERLNALSTNFNWTTSYLYDAQQLCAYETIALGYSDFCELFTYQEWLDFEQAIDIDFAGTYGFQSPTGRAVGIGYVEEVLARLQHHYITTATGSVNVTLDDMASTFPLNQSLYFDFSHDVNIGAVLTAFGLTQFSGLIPNSTYDANRSLIVSHMEPFGARLDIEMIKTPYPVSDNRTNSADSVYDKSGNETTYIHFVLNQRTIPLGESFSECGTRTDGWCELNNFLTAQASSLATADYNFACNGSYGIPYYGEITNGAPLKSTQ